MGQALASAQSTINGLTASDRASVVLFGTNTEVALRSAADKGRLVAAVSGVQPSASGTRFGPALKLAGSILSESALPRREVFLISDFQRGGWQGSEGVRLPDGAVLTPVPIADSGKPNLSIVPVSLQLSEFQDQQRITVTTGAVNHTDAAISKVDVEPRDWRPRDPDAPNARLPRGVRRRRASIRSPSPSATSAAASGSRDDALARDNVFHFVVSPEAPVRVVIGERSGAQRNTQPLPDARRRRQRGAADRRQDPSSRLTVGGRSRQRRRRDPERRAGRADHRRTAAALRRRGRRVVLRTRRAGRLAVGRPTSCRARQGRPSIARAAPPLDSARSSTVIRSSRCSAARVRAISRRRCSTAIRNGDAAGQAGDVQTLARFDDGAPALIERRVGTGRVLMWTSTLDTGWTDLALKPVFVPFVHRIIRYLAAYREPKPWRTVGDVVDPGLQAPARGSDVSRVALTPGGERISLDGDGPEVLELAEQGFYEFRAQSRSPSSPPRRRSAGRGGEQR